MEGTAGLIESKAEPDPFPPVRGKVLVSVPGCPMSIESPSATSFFDSLCANPLSMEALNQYCFCVSVDPAKLHDALLGTLGAHGVPDTLAQTHPHLFAGLPVYVSRANIERVEAAVRAIEVATGLAEYRAQALSWAPDIGQYDPGSPGGLLGMDFHLSPDGPRLIEINTNPGGVLLNTLMGQVQDVCMPSVVVAPTDAAAAERAVIDLMREEWRLQRGDQPMQVIAIVDEAPSSQYLYPEFLLFRELFSRHGLKALICAPEELHYRDGSLWADGERVDMIYNRLTDFPLTLPAHAALRAAYLAGHVVLSPHPRAHALYADKRNLILLGDPEFLGRAGADAATIDILAKTVPKTTLVTGNNRDELWSRRRQLFFKPASGFGSKASYRGDKMTRRVWDEMAAGTYIAQALVAPSERHVSGEAAPLKADIRCYAYRGEPLLYAARLYQGQTTNFRTPGGGFAPVLTAAP